MRFVFDRLTVPVRESDPRYGTMSAYFPWFYEKRYRIPLLFFYRIGRAMTVRKGKARSEIRALKK